LALALAMPLGGGCATSSLHTARGQYQSGQVDRAQTTLADAKIPERDRVLYLMERGMIRQSAGDFTNSVNDLITAAAVIRDLETYSLSQGAASWVVNDTVQSYRGAPYEQVLLHAFAAKNHLALAHWNDAGVEARRIIDALQQRGDYPDVAYARYLAGLCLQLQDDPSNAAMQFRRAAELVPSVFIDPDTGRFYPASDFPAGTNATDRLPSAFPREPWPQELVCLIGLGRTGGGRRASYVDRLPGLDQHAEIRAGDQVLGRSYLLTDTLELGYLTDQIRALRETLKTVGRIAAKEAVAYSVERQTQNSAMGDLVRVVLIGLLEQPDERRWETLPRLLHIARVPCPPDLKEFQVLLKDSSGRTLRTLHVNEPITRHRNTYISFCTDLPSRP
jgi:hypothetical protein